LTGAVNRHVTARNSSAAKVLAQRHRESIGHAQTHWVHGRKCSSAIVLTFDASVLGNLLSMLLPRVNRRLATLGLVLLFLFASLAVGHASENVPDGSVYTIDARLHVPSKFSRAERYGLLGSLDCENCDVSIPFTKFSAIHRPLDATPAVRADPLAALDGHVPRISVHMLASVLLI
jgi:hypothetical protein